ncbi:methyltransferase [Pseudonocardia acidicola]|uniref:Methyltransferase n=1 Tax=Pseudonocardia acidicola TaxID=2724939 RepID=A0ABX1SAG0_9PSEU|nr:methyltransferase [Pseudonocardia acidicola]NMH97807.1 methyltransferase [Pseudonocardia acidicola]
MDAATELRRMVDGYQVSQALHVAATLGISDVLAAGPRTVADLAVATGTHEGSLSRLMRALASVGVYARDDDGRFANTELGEALRAGTPGSVAGWAGLIGRPYYWQAWAGLADSVRTGENAFATVHGESIWAYRAKRPDELVIFDRAMTALSAAVAGAVVEAYDFDRFGTIVDVGGGRGGLLAAILTGHPSMRGVLFDQPDVVAGASELLERAGVADRATTVGGDFFDAVPEGGDAYLLKAVVHDWPDAESIAILRTCRRAVPAHGTLLLIEQLLDDGPDPGRAAFSDLNMLVAPGGQERSVDDYRSLLAAAGFHLVRAVPTTSDVFVLEATPA